MTETQLAKAIRDAVNASRMAYVVRVQSGVVSVRGARMQLADAGTPDALGYLIPSGRALAIEVKTASGKLRPAQEEWMAKAREAGVLCIVARSPTEALEALLDERKQRRNEWGRLSKS